MFTKRDRNSDLTWRRGVVVAVCVLVLAAGTTAAETLYLDGNLSERCPATYNIAQRDCSGTDGVAFASLDEFESMYDSAFSSGDTLIIRPGRYWNEQAGHGLWLADTAQGTEQVPTVVTTLPGEERLAVLCASAATCGTYNPDPTRCGSDELLGNSYYPEAAVAVFGDYMEIRNLKTYGQVKVLSGSTSSPIHDVLVEGCDLGGGGPSIGVSSSQGMVVAIKNAHDIVIRNNRIHHSTCGEASHNGATILGYNFHALVENNEFLDHYDAAVFVKDTGEIPGQSARTFIVRNNLMHGESLGGTSAGVRGQNQDAMIRSIEVHNNVMIGRSEGVRFLLSGPLATLVHNNTFVNPLKYDVGDQANLPSKAGRAYNNLHYNDRGYASPYFFFSGWHPDDVEIDYNCYDTRGDGVSIWNLAGVRHMTFEEWSGVKDSHGVEIDAAFEDMLCVTIGNCQAGDFRRKRYEEEMTGSPYGTRCGAYETGDEKIGVDWVPSQPCRDGLDNDGDGEIDLEDANCSGPRGEAEFRCGDGVLEPRDELCDGVDLGGATCLDLGFSGGALACLPGCLAFDESGCTP